jgi:hypothetical protein
MMKSGKTRERGQGSYRSLNAIVEQSKNCPYGVNTTIEIKIGENIEWLAL